MSKLVRPYIPLHLPADEAHPIARTIYRPVTTATVIAPNGVSARWEVLLDSGSDECLFPIQLAMALRLDLNSLPRSTTMGVGSESNITFYSVLVIDLGDRISFPAYSGFTSGMNAVRVGLLGQSDFFKTHNVEFRLHENIFTIEKVSSSRA